MRYAGIKKLARAENVKQLPCFKDPCTGKRIPMFEMGGFINTPEGWKLYGDCIRAGDMTSYREARVRYDEAHRAVTAG